MAIIPARRVVVPSDETVVLRTTTPEDAAEVVALETLVARETASTYAEENKLLSEGSVKELLHNYIVQPGWLHLVAEAEGALVGLADVANQSQWRLPNTGQISLLVRSDWRGRGVGANLMTAILDWAVPNPIIERLSLWVRADNGTAIALYRRFGFDVVGRVLENFKLTSGQYRDCLLMSRKTRGDDHADETHCP